MGAGPLVSKDLANLGAQVLRVESENHVDPLRFIPPWKDGIPNVSTGHSMANVNQSKTGIAVDLGTDAGREIAYRMVEWADVVVESFTPGTAAGLGLDYATLAQRNPKIIMLSSCMRGQTGPEAKYTGFGLQGAALAGLVAITGWPDRIPSGPWGAYTDFIAPRFSLAALGRSCRSRDLGETRRRGLAGNRRLDDRWRQGEGSVRGNVASNLALRRVADHAFPHRRGRYQRTAGPSGHQGVARLQAAARDSNFIHHGRVPG